MASGFNWSSRCGINSNNISSLADQLTFAETRKRPFSAISSQIACRFCDRIFMTNRDLINHIEVHPVENLDSVSRSMQMQQHFALNPHYYERDQNIHPANLLQPNIPAAMPSPSTITAPCVNTAYNRLMASGPMRPSQIPSLAADDSFYLRPQMEGPPLKLQCQAPNDPEVNDITRPFFYQHHQQRDAPAESESDEKVDLTLKL